jgi:hypothetical protein
VLEAATGEEETWPGGLGQQPSVGAVLEARTSPTGLLGSVFKVAAASIAGTAELLQGYVTAVF